MEGLDPISLTLPGLSGKHASYLARLVHKHIACLLQISKCQIGNGQSTYFWLDGWLLPEPLATAFAAIFSHHLNQNALVATIIADGIGLALRNRLTSAVENELVSVNALLQSFSLSGQVDRRTLVNG